MTEYVFAKPREGGRVRRPDQAYRPMRADGEHVPCIDYYNRLIIAGDIIVCDPPQPITTNTTEPASAKPSRQPKEH